MTAGDLLSMSWTNLTRRKGRTALTAAGVIVGVAALVLMISLGLGLQLEVLKIFENEDELRALHVSRPASDPGKDRSSPFSLMAMLGAQVLPIDENDLAALGAMPGVARVLPELDLALRFKVETPSGARTIPFAPVGAAHPEEEERYRKALQAGRLWSSREERGCLLPRQVLDIRFHMTPEEILGKKIIFAAGNEASDLPADGLVYTVVGVFDAEKTGFKGRKLVLSAARMEELRELTKGGLFYPIPYKKGTYASATVVLAEPKEVETVRSRLRNAGYDVVSTSDMIKMINVIFLLLEALMGCIGAIGLVVSLFGIANTMAMAVLERTREIGIMKALGARNRDIGRLFLSEAAAIGALGGVVGLSLAWVAGKLLNWVARGALSLPAGMSLFHVSLWLAAGSVAFSVFVSVLAGALPARRAARMDPVRSLRYE